MSNLTQLGAAEDETLFVGLNYNMNLIFGFIATIFTIVSSFFAIQTMKDCIMLPKTARYILKFALINGLVNLANSLITRLATFIHGTWRENPRNLFLEAEECKIFGYINIVTSTFTFSSLIGLTIDRLVFTLVRRIYITYEHIIIYLVSFITFLSALVVGLYAFYKVAVKENLPVCFYLPLETVDRLNLYSTVFIFFSVIINAVIFFYIKYLESRPQASGFSFKVKFQLIQNTMAAQIIFTISLVQLFSIALTVIPKIIFLGLDFSYELSHASIPWLSGLAYSQISLPIAIIIIMRRVIANRQEAFAQIQTDMENQDIRLKEAREKWIATH